MQTVYIYARPTIPGRVLPIMLREDGFMITADCSVPAGCQAEFYARHWKRGAEKHYRVVDMLAEGKDARFADAGYAAAIKLHIEAAADPYRFEEGR